MDKLEHILEEARDMEDLPPNSKTLGFYFTPGQLQEFVDELSKEQRRIIENEMRIEQPESKYDKWTNFVIEGVLQLINPKDIK